MHWLNWVPCRTATHQGQWRIRWERLGSRGLQFMKETRRVWLAWLLWYTHSSSFKTRTRHNHYVDVPLNVDILFIIPCLQGPICCFWPRFRIMLGLRTALELYFLSCIGIWQLNAKKGLILKSWRSLEGFNSGPQLFFIKYNTCIPKGRYVSYQSMSLLSTCVKYIGSWLIWCSENKSIFKSNVIFCRTTITFNSI